MSVRIALVGNPNCGKTTLFNTLTGLNSFVGNWSGVTVEKSEGVLRGNKNIIITDLPGIYSLSLYSSEEIIARNYLVNERPDVIINVVDGTNLERNLYLTTQLIELEIPMVIAVNMLDVVKKNGDKIDIDCLSKKLGCCVVGISALKGTGVKNAVELAVSRVGKKRKNKADFSNSIFKERYKYIDEIIASCYKKSTTFNLSTTYKIDRIVTNKFLALPIFVVIMLFVYFISVTLVGAWVSGWISNGLFGEGWHLFNIGAKEYNKAVTNYVVENIWTEELEDAVVRAGKDNVVGADNIIKAINNKDFNEFNKAYFMYKPSLEKKGYNLSKIVDDKLDNLPQPDEFGIWIQGAPVLVEKILISLNAEIWLSSLILDGVIGGVSAVIGFAPQIFVLFLLLAFLEQCGYMSRLAFILDRIFRKFGLSGKSFIPIIIGTGCGVPGIMASRAVENETERKITAITTTFMPCGAKLPVIALISSLFNNGWWVAPSVYFIGIMAILTSGLILKKLLQLDGKEESFVIELPNYRMPTLKNVLKYGWEKSLSFAEKIFTVILPVSVLVWVGTFFCFSNTGIVFNTEMELEISIIGFFAKKISRIFEPIGFNNVKAVIATIMGLVGKEEIVGVFGVLDFEGMNCASAYSFLIFNLLCAPCIAAVTAIKREMNSIGWMWFAVAYQMVFAYAISFIIYNISLWAAYGIFGIHTVIALMLPVVVIRIICK